MRALGLDYGSKTVGVAATDSLGLTVQGVEVIWRNKENQLRETLRRITELASERKADRIIVGYPLNMDGTEGDRAEKSKAFAKMLERRTNLPVFLWDERLTTVEADEILAENGVEKGKRKQYIDKIAAVLILEDYLNAQETSDLPGLA